MTLFALRASQGHTLDTRADQLGGRQVIRATFDASRNQGAITAPDAEKLVAAIETARAERQPFVATVASSGADINEGVAALHGWGLIAAAMSRASGLIPLILVLDGPAVSGSALLLGLADHVVMTQSSYAFVSGPRMVRQFTGMSVTPAILGGAAQHDRVSGVASVVVADLDEAHQTVVELLGFLPDSCDALAPRYASADPVDRPTPEAGEVLPATAAGSYDVRDIISILADDDDGRGGNMLELHRNWAPNIVTTLALIGGQPVGVVANQPSQIAGTLDIPASQKGAGFVSMCDAFNLPLVTLIDTPGFYPGKDLEWRGMIRHGAQLAFAYARASVPRISVTLRKSYGGAHIVMDSRQMGNDLAFAWPTAEIAVMGAKGAVEILHRGADAQQKTQEEHLYAERLLNPYIAAQRGLIDAVIDPADTRQVIAESLETLDSKAELLAPRSHGNTPL